MLGYFLRFVGLGGWAFDPLRGRNDAVIALTRTPAPTLPAVPLATSQGFYSSSGGDVVAPDQAVVATAETLQVLPTYTPYPTFTPYPTQRPVIGQFLAVGFSYYWPPFGPPNCSPENWHDNFCEDVTSCGLPWTDYIGRGVAVPLEWREIMPCGTTVRVHTPVEMVGDFIVLDYCGDCIKKEGHIYFDFLDNRARLNWTVPMLVEIILPG